MTWFVGFCVTTQDPVSATRLSKSDALKDRLAGVMQVGPQLGCQQFRIVLAEDGPAESAVGKSTEALWTLFEAEEVTATIDRAHLGPDLDCTSLVRDLERLRYVSLHQSC